MKTLTGIHPEFAKDAPGTVSWKNSEILFRNWESVPQTAADGSIPEATRHREVVDVLGYEGTQPEGKAENQSDRYRRVFCRRTVEDPYGRMDLAMVMP